ncbi:sulfatase-like hydrolase/transferase [Persicobacter psychrovividus]|uniref:Sulfatase n=1 Tax=Persicobacter psychrovividus TaxID=387638 RepID=A0ABN6LJD1_9BACT|nr:sulfatase [Persicobacter psychrovividus]
MISNFFRKTALALAAIAIFGSCNQAKKKPNFLFVLVDDQTPFDLKVYNASSPLNSPAIDKLAEEGVVIDAARHMGSMNGAVCTPSRHMIMTGRSVWHLPKSAEFQNQTAADPLDTMSIGAIFNRAGYKTMRTCKAGNSYPGANKQFSVVKDKTKRGSTDETGSAWHAEQVLNYLDGRVAQKEEAPFFIYFGFSHPHDTRNGKPDLLKKYGAVNHKSSKHLPALNPNQPPLPDNYLTEHPFFHGHPDLRDEERVSGVWKNRDEATIRNEQGRELACSENIDIQLAKVLDRLEQMGELENTYIIYTSDHGIALGRHGLMGKQNLYEHSLRVPFIVKGPGVKQGKRVKGNVYLSDILPTVCDLAEIPIPETVEGKSMVPLLDGSQETIREVMYGVYAGGTKPGMRTVIKDGWKLIKYDLMQGQIQQTQLFNLEQNSHEYLPEHKRSHPMETNLADKPEYALKRQEMEQLLLEQMQAHDDPYRLWDQTDASVAVTQ